MNNDVLICTKNQMFCSQCHIEEGTINNSKKNSFKKLKYFPKNISPSLPIYLNENEWSQYDMSTNKKREGYFKKYIKVYNNMEELEKLAKTEKEVLEHVKN